MARDGVDGFHDEELPQRPFVEGAFVGFRSWRIDNGRLQSVSYPYVWQQGVNKATCLSSRWTYSCDHKEFKDHLPDHACRKSARCADDDTLGKECGCGFWAYGSDRQWSAHSTPRVVLGMVWGWGRMVIGELGFRAEYASIAALLMPPTHMTPQDAADVEADLAEHYWSVPVYRSQAELFAALPPTPTAPLLPPRDECEGDAA